MKKFRQVYVEITNVCNLNCAFCPKHNRENGYMSVEQFELVAKSIAPLTRVVCLHLMGEPLLHPDFERIVEIANQNGLQIYLTTNGTLLKKHLDVFKKALVKRISVSLHSYEANAINKPLREYLWELFNLAQEITTREHVFVEFRLWNENSAKSTLNSQIIDVANEFFGKSLPYNFTDNQFLTKEIYFSPDEIFEWPENTVGNAPTTKKFCYALQSHFGVLCNGSVVACCLDNNGRITLGNIFDTPINEILSSKRAVDIKDGFKKGIAVEDLCKTCSFANKFEIK